MHQIEYYIKMDFFLFESSNHKVEIHIYAFRNMQNFSGTLVTMLKYDNMIWQGIIYHA